MNVFEIVCNSIDIIVAAEFYGLRFKHKKAFCPFHNDQKTPNMSFKDNRFKCFSCNASGSVIDLVKDLFSLTPIEAARKLNDDFGLHIKELDEPYHISFEQKNEYQQDKQLYDSFEAWVQRSHKIVAAYFRKLNEDIRNYAPKKETEPLNPKFVDALHERDYIEYVLDILSLGDFNDKLQIYKMYRKKVSEIETKTKEDEYIGEDVEIKRRAV